MKTARFLSLLLLCALSAILCQAQGLGRYYADPGGGWTYAYLGALAAPGDGTNYNALDGAWSHNNGSDAWDGSGLGGPFSTGGYLVGNGPGGVMAMTESNVTFLRIQDCGDPSDHSFPDPSNRKILFGRNLAADGVSSTFMDDGVTLFFRARIATTGLLDPQYPDSASNGENRTAGAGAAWPAGGNGYLGHDNGKGHFAIRQSSAGVIGFSLMVAGDQQDNLTVMTTNALVMNSLNGTAASGTVDAWQREGSINMLPMPSLTDGFHEFWIVIRRDPAGTGSHQVEVYVDGALTPQTFKVTMGTGNDYSGLNYMAMGCGATGQQGGIDVDCFAYKIGALAPTPADTTSPVGLTADAADLTVPEGTSALFSVTATGAPPLLVTWQRGDHAGGFTNIPSATHATLTIGPVNPLDNGALFRCIVSNSFSAATSRVAQLTVLTDTNPPTVLSITGDPDMTRVWVQFSEKVAVAQAQGLLNYVLDPPLAITAATLDATGTRLMLTTEAQPARTPYTLTVVDGLDDLAYTPNRMTGGTTLTFTSWAPSPGFLCARHYLGISGTAVTDLTGNVKYPSGWEILYYVNAAQTAATSPNVDNYGGRLTGWIQAPAEGFYTFFIRGDDGTQLRLGTSADPATLTAIASQASANQPFASGASSPVFLQAGQLYAMEAIWKEASGGDYVQIAWQTPLSTETNIIPASALVANADPNGVVLAITNPPPSRVIFQNRATTFTVQVNLAPTNTPLVYYWERDSGGGVFTNVAITLTNSYTTPLLTFPVDDQSSWRVIVGAPGARATSAVATVTVSQDSTPPQLVSARSGGCDAQGVTLEFNELLDRAFAAIPTAYRVINLVDNSEIAIDDLRPPTVASDGKTVALYLVQPLTNGTFYRISAYAADLVGNTAETAARIVRTGILEPNGPQNLVVIEAEDADDMVRRVWEGVERYWAPATNRAGFSGRGAMRVLPNTEGNRPGSAEGASLDFCISFAVAGTYYVWVRGGAEGGADNSIHVGLNGTVPDTARNSTDGYQLEAGGWFWGSTHNDGTAGRIMLDIPGPGVHRVQVFMREDGFYCDKILLTTDVNFNPSTLNGGLGPDATARPLVDPVLSLAANLPGPGGAAITWSFPGAILQAADSITGPWTAVPGATSPYQPPAGAAQKFYRVSVAP